jgi:hypothetical protein
VAGLPYLLDLDTLAVYREVRHRSWGGLLARPGKGVLAAVHAFSAQKMADFGGKGKRGVSVYSMWPPPDTDELMVCVPSCSPFLRPTT